MYDQSYQHIATVEAGGELTNLTDPHDVRPLSLLSCAASLGRLAHPLSSSLLQFQITPDDTAVIETWIPREMDLSPLGGPTSGGFAFDCVIQEVDIATGELLFQWRSMDHIPLTETLYELLKPAGTKGQRASALSSSPLVVLASRLSPPLTQLRPERSLRCASPQRRLKGRVGQLPHLAARAVDRLLHLARDGRDPVAPRRVQDELQDGRQVSSSLLPVLVKHVVRAQPLMPHLVARRTDFHFQHHSRLRGSGASSPFTVTLFSNGANQFRQTADQARALILKVDTDKMEVELEKEYLPSFHMPCSSEGSMQILDNGNVVVGWGIRASSSRSPLGALGRARG